MGNETRRQAFARPGTSREGTRMVPVYYSPSYAAAGFAFPTTRKARWIADSLSGNSVPGLTLEEPRPLTEENILETHDAYYVRAIRTGEPRSLAESQDLQ